MKARSAFRFLISLLLLAVASSAGKAGKAGTETNPAEVHIASGSVTARVLVQSPVQTETELQITCLFESVPANALHGSLVEIKRKVKGPARGGAQTAPLSFPRTPPTRSVDSNAL
jgi:hypothetical protein